MSEQDLVDISRISLLTDWQIEAYAEVEKWVNENDGLPNLRTIDGSKLTHGKCPAIVKKGHVRYVGKQCTRKAGQGTSHLGYGHCMAHGGAKKYGRAVGAWLMAHAFAQELNVTPWEALLRVIRITAGRVAYCEQVLSSAMSDDEIEGKVEVGADGRPTPLGMSEDGEVVTGRNMKWWVDTSERERDRLAKVSKAAIDAGVAQMLVQQATGEGERIASVAMKALDAMENAGMPIEWLEVARNKMIEELESFQASSFAQREIEA